MPLRTMTLMSPVIAGAMALSACGSQAGSGEGAGETTAATSTDAAADVDNAAAQASAMPADAGGAAAGMALPLTGQAYVDAAAASDQFEIESSRIAQSKGLTGEWRTFAEQMTKDHTQSSSQLKTALARVPNVTVDKAPKMTDAQTAQLKELQNASTADFPALYARQQLAAHEQALALHTNYAASGDAQPLMEFAGTVVPVVRSHLDHVRRMQ